METQGMMEIQGMMEMQSFLLLSCTGKIVSRSITKWIDRSKPAAIVASPTERVSTICQTSVTQEPTVGYFPQRMLKPIAKHSIIHD